jgi:hypothetical protein
MQEQFIKGSCLCGAYTFRISPSFIKFGFASCHCSICRKMHAAPVIQWGGMKAEHNGHFIITSANNDERSTEQVKDSLSKFRTSPECLRYFCGTCGSHVFIEYDRYSEGENDHKKSPWEGEIHFPTALLDEESVILLEEVRPVTVFCSEFLFIPRVGC